MAGKRRTNPLIIGGVIALPVLLVCSGVIWLIATALDVAFATMFAAAQPNDAAVRTSTDPAQANAILKSGRLAPLAASATDVRCGCWSGGFAGECFLRFQTTPEDISQFISNSGALAGARPAPLQRMPAGPTTPEWFTIEPDTSAMTYDVPPDSAGRNSGVVIINASRTRVLVHLFMD